MSTRSSARNLFPPLDNPMLTIRRRSHADPTLLNDFEMATEGNGDPPVPDLRTMEELCQPSSNGRGAPIAPIAIQATNFGLKNDMIQQVQNSYQFHGLSGDDDKHLDKFLHVTQSIKVNGSPMTPFMAKMFLGKYFPPSMVTKLRNEITNFRQRPDESLFEAWERYKLSIDRCPNHNRLPVTQIDAFYNGLTLRHRDTINAAAQRSESSSSITYSSDLEIMALKAGMAKINKNLMRVLQVNQQVKAVTPSCKTCGGPHSYNDCPATVGQTQSVYAAGAYQGVNSYQPQGNHNLLSYRSENYLGPPGFNQNPNRNNQNQNFQNQNRNQGHNHGIPQENNQGRNQFFQGASHGQNSPPAYQAPAYQAPDALILILKFGPTIKTLLTNKDKLSELAITPLNKHCSAVLLKKLPEKLGDPDKFLIPCDFPGMDKCLALADIGASINLMPLSVWNKLFLPELSPTCMTLKLADRSISRPVGVAEDVFVKVGKFHFPAGFVVVDFDADPRIPIILGRNFLMTERAFIDVFEGELTIRVGKEAITFNLDQTSRYSANYNDMTANQIDVIDMACEQYSQEVLGFSDVIATFFNDDPSLPPPTQGKYLPQVRKELKICEAKNNKSSIDERPKVELKDLPPHIEYAFLEGNDKVPVIIAKDLSNEEKVALIKVLKSHTQAIAWKLSDIKGYFQIPIDPKDQEKNTFTCPYGTFAYHRMPFGVCNAPGTFQRFVTPCAIINDRGIHFCNDQFAKVMLKYGVTYRLATAYHPQTSGRVEVSNRGLKRILKRTVGENRAFWSDKLDDALWAFRTAFKTPIGCTPYKLVYEKACHLSIELEYKAYWALKHANFNLRTVGDHRKVQLNELNELRDQAYENSLIYKEKTKRLHDSKIKDRVFNVGDRVLLFNSSRKIFLSKLNTRWSGPFTITHVFPYGTVELSQIDGPNFKVNGHRLKHYFGEGIPKMVVMDLQTFQWIQGLGQAK
nr:reverse transcriptase domain-containing protein [Tanacetum cinerariifolium]